MADLIMHWHRYETKKIQSQALAKRVATELRAALQHKSRASLVVPGGSTPVAFFQEFSKSALDWTRVDILPSDERFVPLTSSRSNTRLIQENLQQNAAAESKLIPFWQPDTTAENMAKQLAHALPTPFDVCVLGMGADMHTASLFPHTKNLARALNDPNDEKVFVVQPEDQEIRLSLSAPVLAGAKHMHLLIIGVEKKQALERAALIENAHLAPIKALIIKHNNINVHYTN